MKNWFTQNKYPIIIFFIFYLYVVLLLTKIWPNDNFIPDWDEGHHLIMGYRYFTSLSPLDTNLLKQIYTHSFQIYPPLYHFLIGVAFLIFGPISTAAIYVNMPFVLIMMLSIYGLGKFFDNKLAGFIAAALTPALPIFLTLQERAAIDYASISMFLLSFYLLFKTQFFTNRKYSILFGITILLGLLIKWSFFIPAIPFIVYAFYSLKIQKDQRRLVFANIVIALSISLVAASWYITNSKYIISGLSFFWDPNGYPQKVWNFPQGFTVKNIMLYFVYATKSRGVGILVLIYFLLSFFLPKKNKNFRFVSLSILVTYVVLTIMNDKSEVYIGYSYPLLMLATALGILNLKSTIKSTVLLVLFVTVVLTNFTYSQLEPWSFEKYAKYNSRLVIFPNYFTTFGSEKWPTKQIVDNYMTFTNCPKGVLVFPDNRYLNYSNVQFYIVADGKQIIHAPAHRFYNPSTDSGYDLSSLQKYSCILTKTGDVGDFANPETIKAVDDYLISTNKYLTYKFLSPDQTLIFLHIEI